jgi:hypothetical protein
VSITTAVPFVPAPTARQSEIVEHVMLASDCTPDGVGSTIQLAPPSVVAIMYPSRTGWLFTIPVVTEPTE